MATTTISQTRIPQLGQVQMLGLTAAVLGIGVLVAGYFLNPTSFFESYIYGYYVAMTIPLGCLGFLMVQHLTGGAWGVTVRRMLEAGAATLPIMGLLFIPIALGYFDTYKALGLEHPLYEWANPEVVTPGGAEFDPIIAHKVPWLSPLWVTARIAIFFVIWTILAYTLRAWSRQQDVGGDAKKLATRMRRLSGIGAALFVITVTFFSFDVAMSLDPHWFSTIYGAHYMANAGLMTLAFLALMMSRVRDATLFREYVSVKPIHDIGKLIFAFTVLWTYMSYGQLIIIWSGDVAEFTPWYVHRTQHGWVFVALALMLFAFALPFFVLLFRGTKRNLNTLATIAGWIVLMRFVDMAWIILPEFREHLWDITITDVAAPIGLIGLVVALFAANVQQAPLLPLRDPNMEQLQNSGHH